MRYKINATLYYDACDGSLTLPGSDQPDTHLSITANALLFFFIRNPGIISRDEVLKKVWDDNGLTSSNSNLNQYLSLLRKTLRYYGVENIIITIPKGNLELNPEVVIELVDDQPRYKIDAGEESVSISEAPAADEPPAGNHADAPPPEACAPLPSRGVCWYLASGLLLLFTLALGAYTFFGNPLSRPVALTPISHSQCELLVNDDMLNTAAGKTNFDAVRQRLALKCQPGERFVFFYGDKLQTNGLGRVFLAHCAMHEANPFSYCDNYFYYSWNPQ